MDLWCWDKMCFCNCTDGSKFRSWSRKKRWRPTQCTCSPWRTASMLTKLKSVLASKIRRDQRQLCGSTCLPEEDKIWKNLQWKAILVKYCLNANRAIMNAWIHIFIWITWSTNFKSKFVCHFRPKNRRNPSLHQARDSNHDRLSCAWICRRSWHPRTHYLRFWWSRTHGNGNYLWSWSFLEYTQILTQTLSWSFIQPN